MRRLLCVISIAIIFFSCKKDSAPDPITSLPTITTNPVIDITETTAVSGGNINADGGASIIARGVCWSTESGPGISDSHSTDGTGTGIFNSSITGLNAGTIYYVRAYATNNAGTAYGAEVSFTTTSAMSPANLYAVGEESDGNFYIAKIWKNGVSTSLTSGSADGYATSVYVSGTDVYVSGYENGPVGTSVAKIWKNGVATNLTAGTTSAGINSVLVSGTDTYAAGYEYNSMVSVAKIWKNGIATTLSNVVNNANARSVFVTGADVYVAGYELIGLNQDAKLWKNGISSSLTTGTIAVAEDVFVYGTDVYVAGGINLGSNT